MTGAVLWQSVGDILRGAFIVWACLLLLAAATFALAAAREHLARRRDVRTVKARGAELTGWDAALSRLTGGGE